MEFLIIILLIMLAVVISKLTNIIFEISQQRRQFHELSKLIEQSLLLEKTTAPILSNDNEQQQTHDRATSNQADISSLPEPDIILQTQELNETANTTAVTDRQSDEPIKTTTLSTIEPINTDTAKQAVVKDDSSIYTVKTSLASAVTKGSIASEVEEYIQSKATKLAKETENKERTLLSEPQQPLTIEPVIAERPENTDNNSTLIEHQDDLIVTPMVNDPSPDFTAAPESIEHSPEAKLTQSVWEQNNNTTAPKIKSESSLIAWWKYIEQQFASRWMVWIGGAIMALGVIFLVKIGNDHGLFGPKIRIGIATAIGIAMTVGGELLRRSRFHLKLASGQYIPAALSGAGIIALYASMLGANYIYNMFPLTALFIILTAISATAMALAIRQGPFMAALGIVGAYMVPLFISTGSGNVTGLLIYVAIVSFGSLTLLNKIYRRWLWWGALAGNYSWLLLAIFISPSDHQIARGLFLLATTYSFLALPHFGWRLLDQNKNPKTSKQDGLLTGGIAASLLILMASNNPDSIWLYLTIWLSCTSLLFIARRIPLLEQLSILGSVSIILLLSAMQKISPANIKVFNFHQTDVDSFPLKLLVFGSLAALYAFFAAKAVIKRTEQQLMWALISTITPIIMLVMLYSYYPMIWVINYSLFAKIVVLTIAASAAVLWYSMIMRHAKINQLFKSIYSIAANIIMALALSFAFVEAQITALLAIQMLISVALIKWRSQFVSHWVFKGLMLIILMRLSFNPAIFDYTGNLLGIPWTLYGYGIPVLCLWLVMRWLSNNPVYKSTLQLAQINVIYLLGLWVNIELRHVMHGSYQISLDFKSLTDVSLHALTFGIMTLAYIYRAPLSGLAFIYRSAAKIFGCLTLLLAIGGSLFIYNPLFSPQNVGSLPLINIVTAAYGLPAVMLVILLTFWPNWINTRLKSYASGLLVIFGMLFITLFVRQLWHGNYLNQPLIYVGEQYFYSFVWMVTAIVMMILAIKKRHLILRRASLALLCLTIVKLFVWDMSGLTGFYRPISFIGLGICLVAMGWFYQRFVILDNGKDSNDPTLEKDKYHIEKEEAVLPQHDDSTNEVTPQPEK